MKYKFVIAIDFDGVIFNFNFKEWKKQNELGNFYIGELKENAIESLKYLQENCCYIIVHSARITEKYEEEVESTIQPRVDSITAFANIAMSLGLLGVPYNEIWMKCGKPVADIYIDDKGIRFFNWKETVKIIEREVSRRKIAYDK